MVKRKDFGKKKKKATQTDVFVGGGDARPRICDPLRVKQVLYRLSYASKLVTGTSLELVLPP